MLAWKWEGQNQVQMSWYALAKASARRDADLHAVFDLLQLPCQFASIGWFTCEAGGEEGESYHHHLLDAVLAVVAAVPVIATVVPVALVVLAALHVVLRLLDDPNL